MEGELKLPCILAILAILRLQLPCGVIHRPNIPPSLDKPQPESNGDQTQCKSPNDVTGLESWRHVYQPPLFQ